jgi:putative chitinase
MITAELLQRLGYRGMPLAVAQAWATALNAAAARYQINTPLRLAHWLAQILHESGGLYYVREVWGPTAAQLRYEGRLDLGNTQRGDGERYMGRGPVQVTGRGNYRSAGKRLGLDLEGHPELAEEPVNGALIAGDYWNSRGLNSRANRGGESMVETISAAINGRNRQGVPNHLPERLARFRQVWAVLSEVPVQRFVLVDPGGKQAEWNGRDKIYNGVTLGPELLAALDLAYPVAGGPWEYGRLKIWRRQSGVFVLERIPQT